MAPNSSAAAIKTERFFDRDAQVIAQDVLGKVLWHRVNGQWLGASIIEAEAYYLEERASHASLGFTEKRAALFMPPGTIYMYYARGGDSFNVSCRGAGNAVLFKSGLPFGGTPESAAMTAAMHRLNPLPGGRQRRAERLCSGQTLLCRALGLRVPDWDRQPFIVSRLRLSDVGYTPSQIIRTTRLGIPAGRDGHLPYRFVDYDRAAYCTRNPLRGRSNSEQSFEILAGPEGTSPPTVSTGDKIAFQPLE